MEEYLKDRIAYYEAKQNSSHFYNTILELKNALKQVKLFAMPVVSNQRDMAKMMFKTPNEMVNWLMHNEGKQLADGYGRKWKYEDYKFYYMDVGTYSEYKEGIRCLHLHKTSIEVIQ